MENKKKTYLAILTIVTVAAIIFGSVYHILGAIYHFKELFHIGAGGSSEEVNISNDYENVTDIDIDCAMSKVIIQSGDKVNVTFKGRESLSPEVKLSGGELRIKQKDNKDIKLNDANKDNVLTVTVDDDVTLDSLNLVLAMGDVRMDDIEVADLSIDAAMGNVVADDIECSSADLEAAMGNIDMLDSSFSDLKADAAMGNITVDTEQDLEKYDVDASASMGTIKIDGKQITGNKEYKSKAVGDTVGKINLNCDLGNIDLK